MASMIDKSFYRRLLRSYWQARLMPYHLQDTLFLLSLHSYRNGSAALSSSENVDKAAPLGTANAAAFGVDRHCNPVETSCNMGIDAATVYQTGLSHIRAAMRSTVLVDPKVPQGVRAFKTMVEQGKLFWLLRRLTHMKENPQRVPSAAAEGVHTSVLCARPGTDTFQQSEAFLNLKGVDGCASMDASLRAVHALPSSWSVEDARGFTLTLSTAQCETRFEPNTVAPVYEDGAGGEDDGTMTQPTLNRFCITTRIAPSHSYLHTIVVNSHLFALDMSNQVLCEEVGSMIDPVRIPLLHKSEILRAKLLRGEIDASRETDGVLHSAVRPATLPRGLTRGAGSVPPTDQSPPTPTPSAWGTTVQTSSDGPVAIKGVLYVKHVVEDVATDDQLAMLLAQTPIEPIAFGPLVLQCVLH